MGYLVQGGRQSAASWVAQDVHTVAGLQHRRHQVIERSDVTANICLEAQLPARGQDSYAMVTNRSREDNHVARLRHPAANLHTRHHHANPGRSDVEPVRLALLHDLGVSGNDLHTRFCGCALHGGDDLLQDIDV